MARFIAFLNNSDAPKTASASEALDRGLFAMTHYVGDTLKFESFSVGNGFLSGKVAMRADESPRLHTDLETGVTVFLDGTPQIGDSLVTSRQFANLYLDGNLAASAGDIDGGWIAVVADPRDKCVVVLRDRIGLKPVFFAKARDGFAVASTAGAIVRAGFIGNDVNLDVLARYITCNYRAVLGRPETIYASVSLLGPGQMLTLRGDRLLTEQYWDFDPSVPYVHLPAAELEAMYHDTMDEMIRCFLTPRANDRMAVSLSGGSMSR